ncbi:MAG TPA: PIN domain-containing protein [Thermoanaerobaculia bacterium]|nr:PIN domain-containing protein [Thermoanaerobaculia bacterium]
MRHLLLDADVVLDVLIEREPHVAFASALWAAGERGECRLSISAHAVTTIYYLAARQRDARRARELVGELLSVFAVAPVNQSILLRASGLEMEDFEDAVAAAAAESAGCEAVVTRNLSDFEASPVPAIDPATALAWLELGE